MDIRVNFITPTDTIGASSRYRVYQYIDYLPKNIKYNIYPFMSNKDYKNFKMGTKYKLFLKMPFLIIKRMTLFFICKKNDVIFIHRDIFPFGPMIMEKILKAKGCKIILDLDDAVYCNDTLEISNKGNKFLYKLKYGKRFDDSIRNANIVLCGNKSIELHCRQFNSNCKILPTVIDTEKIKPVKEWKDRKNTIKIAWIGNPGNSNYVLSIIDQIDKYFENSDFNGTLVLIGAQNFDLSKYKNINIIIKKWSIENEYKDLAECDFGIMPLLNTEWSKGKCGAKILQYFATGIPALVSGVGVNLELVKDGITGYVVKNNDWYKGIDNMIKKYDKLCEMGKNGRKLVEEKYSLKANINIFLDSLK